MAGFEEIYTLKRFVVLFLISVIGLCSFGQTEEVYSFAFDTDPGWTTEGQWEFGQPQGNAGDPSSGFTGENVYGYNLDGAYENRMPQYWLTTPALNFEDTTNVTMRFQRWLTTEHPSLDHAYIQVSADGVNWTPVWSSSFSDYNIPSWTAVEYDLSAVADNQPSVYVRWGMGTTDGSVTRGGWNIDDVEFEGVVLGPLRITPGAMIDRRTYLGEALEHPSMTYQLSAHGETPVRWASATSNAWVSLSAMGGTLNPGETVDLVATIDNDQVRAFALGDHVNGILVGNVDTGDIYSRRVRVKVLNRPPLREEFKVLGMHASGARIQEQGSIIGDDRGGIAVGSELVLTTGDSYSGRHNIGNLSNGVRLDAVYDALVSDLRTGRIYSLASGTTPIRAPGGVVNALVVHDPETGLPTAEVVELSDSVNVESGTGIFAGHGYMLLHTGSQAYAISYDTGEVLELGGVPALLSRRNEGWNAYWGIAEWYGGTNYFVYVNNDGKTISRTAAVSDGATETVASFFNLGDCASIAVSPSLNRWYFTWESGNQFGGSSESLGCADATLYSGPADALGIAPFDSVESTGWQGATFTPAEATYTLRNQSSSNLSWMAQPTASWMSVSPTNGVLTPGSSIEIEVSLEAANTLAVGSYAESVAISNLTSGIVQTRAVEVEVWERVFDRFAFESIGPTQFIDHAFAAEIKALDPVGDVFDSYNDAVNLYARREVASETNALIKGVAHELESTGDYMRGIRFTAEEDMALTHLHHYWGTELSVWTDAGVRIFRLPVDAPDGEWTAIALDEPLVLAGGETYRIAAYGANVPFYYNGSVQHPRAYGNGEILSACYYYYSDRFPRYTSTGYDYFVDFSYYVGEPIEVSPLHADGFVDGVWTGMITVTDIGSNVVLLARDDFGHTGESEPIFVDYAGALTLEVPAELDEVPSVAPTGRIEVDQTWPAPLTVYLTSDDPSELTVPETVVLPASARSVEFPLSVQDEALLDGSRGVHLTARAERYLPADASMVIHDNETAVLSVSLPQTTHEGAMTIGGALIVSAAPDEDVPVALISNLPEKIAGTNLVIKAGQTFVPFTLIVADDTLQDGLQTVTLEAQVENWTSGFASVFVMDDETSGIELTAPGEILEGDGVQSNAMTISLAGMALVDTHVLLTPSDATELVLPSFITIPAGTNTVTFDLGVVDDTETDGSIPVSLVVASPGYVPAGATIVVHDNDTHHLDVMMTSNDVDVLENLNVIVQAVAIDGRPTVEVEGPLSFSATGANGAVQVEPLRPMELVGGSATGKVAFAEPGNAVVMSAEVDAGFSGEARPLNVMGPVMVLSPDGLLDTLAVAGETASRTLVISNAGNAALEFDFSGPLEDEAADPALIAAYAFNGDAYDTTGNGHLGSVVGATPTFDRFGAPNSAFHFDGINDYIRFNDVLDRGVESWSCTLWMRSSDYDQAGTILSKGLSSYNSPYYSGYGIQLMGGNRTDKTLDCMQVDDANTRCNVNYALSELPTDRFVFVGWVYDAETGLMSLYVDGVLVSSQTVLLGNSNTSAPLHLGVFYTYSRSAYFKGDIDDLRIYRKALSGLEVRELLSADAPEVRVDLEAGLAASYAFSGDATDASGNGYDGTVNGAVLTEGLSGGSDSAYAFDGVDDYIDVGNPLGTEQTAFTVSAWARSINGRYQVVVAKRAGSYWREGQWELTVNETDVGFLYGNGSGTYYLRRAEAEFDFHDGEWHHLCGVVDAGGAKLYVDGLLRANVYATIPSHYDAPIHIGNRNYAGGEQPFDGDIDEVRIYHRGLAEEEVVALASLGQPGRDSEEVEFAAVEDTYITEHSGYGGRSSVNGMNALVVLKGVAALQRTHTLVRFDLADVGTGLLAGNTVNLDLTFRNAWGGGPVSQSIVVREMLTDWSEAATSWASLGGGFNESLHTGPDLAVQTVTYSGEGQTVTFKLPVAVVQGWLDDPSSNRGLILISNTTEANQDLSFSSKETGPAPKMRIRLEKNTVPATWAAVSPAKGVVAPGGSLSVNVGMSADGLTAGDHEAGVLTMASNDNVQPEADLSASMWILPPAPVLLPEPSRSEGLSNLVAWSSVEGDVEYWAETSSSTNGVAEFDSGWVAETNHWFVGLTSDRTYSYRVKASVETAIGRLEGPWSEAVQSMQVLNLSDIDNDGIPNWWEISFFGSETLGDPALDVDGDGHSNLEEYIAGMNPTNSESCFEAEPVLTNGAFIVTWESVTGRVYSIHWKSGMTNDFQTLETGITHPQNFYMDTEHGTEAAGFYRVEVELDTN